MAEDMEPGFILKRRGRNRLAAQKCRKGKKRHIDNLRAEENDLDCSNNKLKNEIRALKEEIGQLEYLLKSHQCTGKVSLTSHHHLHGSDTSENLTVRELLQRRTNKQNKMEVSKYGENSIQTPWSKFSTMNVAEQDGFNGMPLHRQALQNVQFENDKSFTHIPTVNKVSRLTELLLSKGRQKTTPELNIDFFCDAFQSDSSLPVLEISDLTNI